MMTEYNNSRSGKPVIEGYETDPDQYWTAPRMPELKYDSDGLWEWATLISFEGQPYEDWRLIEPERIDEFMRHRGMKRVYRPRKFHAVQVKDEPDAYRIRCKKCDTTTLAVGSLPHDVARRHWARVHTAV